MHYSAGIFDAEGWVSLTPRGNFIIGLEIAHEGTANDFYDKWGGKIYKPTRKARKQIFSWRIPTNTNEIQRFLNDMMPLCKIKHKQLVKLHDYINQPRANKKNSRPQFVHQIAELKKPTTYSKDQLIFEPTKPIDDHFAKWFAGFMDGDGNFCVYEYENWHKRSFDSWISIFNTFAEPIIYVQQRIKGSISIYKGTKFPIWKWVCNQESSKFVCQSLEPNLILKKEQCKLVSRYLDIHNTKVRGVDYSSEVVSEIRDIIKQIKLHNSL